MDDALPAHLRHGDTEGGDCQTEQTIQQVPTEETTAAQQEVEPEGKPEKPRRSSIKTVKTCDGRSIELKADEKRVLDLHNEACKRQRLEPLCVHPLLTEAARTHSKEMIDENYFSHLQERSDPRCSTQALDYDWCAYSENTAWGSGSYSTPESTLDRWMKSPGHKKNILNGKFREIGAGSVTGDFKGTGGATIYTVDFGTRRR